jgi:type IV secretory pathway TraG/TraD family ATPase VirD4
MRRQAGVRRAVQLQLARPARPLRQTYGSPGLGRIDCLSHAAQFVRGYGMRLAFVIQNKAQLREIYGQHGTADIVDNLGAEVVLGTGDLELAQELEKRLGDDTLNVTTLNRPRFLSWMKPSRQGTAEHPHRRPLLLAQEVTQMPAEDQIILRPCVRPCGRGRSSGGRIASSRRARLRRPRFPSWRW